ncbi:MAG: LamG domain-containing protein [Cyclobacteriaceae bacterium]
MKTINIFLLIILAFSFGCQDGYIDDISAVEPGPDEVEPSVTVTFPPELVTIPFTDEQTDLNFRFEVSDDIEIQSIKLSLDGTELTTLTDFKDYRRVMDAYTYDDLPIGDYTFEIVATDVSGKSTTANVPFTVSNKYVAQFDGEIFYMPFEAQSYIDLLSENTAAVVGEPGFSENAAVGEYAYKGNPDSYLTYPSEALENPEFSAAFWYNVSPDPTRAGILVIGPPDPEKPDTPNNRTSGFRFFREGGETNQIFKLNVGNGTADSWFDGGPTATVNPDTATWVHVAFTISQSSAAVYLDGQVASQGDFAGVDWTGCDIMSIASGAPRFVEWNHLSGNSLLDDLRIFNKALTQSEIQEIIGARPL